MPSAGSVCNTFCEVVKALCKYGISHGSEGARIRPNFPIDDVTGERNIDPGIS